MDIDTGGKKREDAVIHIDGTRYELIQDHKNGWTMEPFRERHSEILTKYDYIVGDWGYGQLRLKGFYEDHRRKVPYESKIGFLDEYIQEYCNFGCAFFVLQKVESSGGQTNQ